MIKLKTAIHNLSKDYTDMTGEEKTASVNLTIDHENVSFAITPSNSPYGKPCFLFINNTANANLWIAVAELITEAVEFAKRDLGI